MIKKQSVMLILFMVVVSSLSLSATTWKILFYMNSTENLNDMAIKGITDMMRAHPNDSVELLIQLHAYHSAGLRYQVTAQGLIFIEEVALTGDSKKDLINAASWGFATVQEADHTMLILSDHGWGILDPQWNPITNEWQATTDSLSNVCLLKNKCYIDMAEHRNHHKGYMFSINPRTYLNNQDLIDTLSSITTDIVKKKLDILGFDTCMGAMGEVAYQVALYADYLVGCQSCSLSDGFNYQGIVKIFNQQPTPRAAVIGMVDAFNSYYHERDASGIYTNSALDLSYAHAVRKALDTVVFLLLSDSGYESILAQAHSQAPRFCMWPGYTDLIAFCKNIEEQLEVQQSLQSTNALKQALRVLYEVTDQFVVARCAGYNARANAHGFAIYLPSQQGVIDDSYLATQFARESQWLSLLQKIV